VTREWRSATLGEATQFINGLWKGEDPPFIHVGVIRNTNFTKEGALDDSDIAYLDVEAKKFQKRRLQFGDLILEKSGGGPKQPVGRVVFFDKTEGDFSFSNFTAAIRVVNPTVLDARFLHKYLHWVYLSGRTEAMQSHSTGIRNLNGDAYKAIKVAYPSLSEQRRIVAILDEAFEGIATAKANAEKNLQNARELFVSHREALLASAGPGWDEALLCNLCDIRHGYAFEGEFFAQEGDYVLLTPGNFFERGGYRDRGEKQKYFTGPIPSDYVLSEGSLLVAMTEQAAGLLGSPLLVPDSDRFLHNQRLGLVVGKPGGTWVNDFFFHVFNLARVRAEIHASASGVKVRHTSPSKIGAVRVAFPTAVTQQREVASRLVELAAECDQLSSVYERKLAALDELKKSLLHQAFTGALS
jgi:type I restriction enzyme S subunit